MNMNYTVKNLQIKLFSIGLDPDRGETMIIELWYSFE